jgi:hypothetical protein
MFYETKVFFLHHLFKFVSQPCIPSRPTHLFIHPPIHPSHPHPPRIIRTATFARPNHSAKSSWSSSAAPASRLAPVPSPFSAAWPSLTVWSGVFCVLEEVLLHAFFLHLRAGGERGEGGQTGRENEKMKVEIPAFCEFLFLWSSDRFECHHLSARRGRV